MNWYKLAQADIQKGKNLGMNYMDIGHTTPTGEYGSIQEKYLRKSALNYLWWWNGKVNVKKLKRNDISSHWELEEMEKSPDGIYSGRAQFVPGGRKLVSIGKPTNKTNYPVPKIIIRSLYKTFGDDIQIIEF